MATLTNLTGIDLSTYVRIGRYDLPEPTRTTAPTNSLLAQEVSAVTYNADTDTLFVVGDGGTSIVQVSKTGQLIDSMTLAPGNSPQGTTFYDPEGLAYVGNGKFAMVEERDRQVNLFTYVPNTTLTRANVQTVKLGTTIGNIGLEGITYDPQTNGFVLAKETQPEGIFQTTINFANGTASNGSPTTENSTNLFDPTLLGLADLADIYSLSNVTTLNGTADASHLLVLSQESGKIVNTDRTGKIFSTLTITADPTDTISVLDQQHEGVTVDNQGILYVTSENGGGDINHPQLWVYAPRAATATNQAPTAVNFGNPVISIADKTSTATRVKVADITVTDDGLGTNNLTLAGTDAAAFEIFNNGLYIKAGTTIDFQTKASYNVTVNVDDPTVGATPDLTKAFSLAVTNPNLNTSGIVITEVAPWASGNSPYAADWFEVTNTGTTAVDITGWKIDDNSNSFGSAVALRGVTSIGAGKSVVFIEGAADGATDATIDAAFSTAWFGTATPPASLTIGHYGGAGVGLSTAGDAVNLFDATGKLITGITFGASTTGLSFDNKAGLGSSTLPTPTVSTLSTVGTNGAFLAKDGIETGSPGRIAQDTSGIVITEVAPWASGNSPYAADWFEVTNTSATDVNISGWKMDDNSNSFGSAVALRGVTTIGAGKSVVFIEGAADGATDATIDAAFSSAWFGTSTVPTGLTIGHYGGAGVGLSTAGDAVNLFDETGKLITGITFGASTTGLSFDNKAGLASSTLPTPTVSTLSAVGTNGAFLAKDAVETGSPGSSIAPVSLTISGTTSNDTLYGGAGDDIITGGLGSDLLFGGAGKDRFVFSGSNQGIDKINDFVVGEDRIDIASAGFGGAAVVGNVGILDAGKFTLGTSATTSSQRFIYNNNSGALFFDADGSGSAAQVRIAQFVGNPALTNASFAIV